MGEGRESYMGSGSPTRNPTAPSPPGRRLSNPLTREVVRRLSTSSPGSQSAEMLGLSPSLLVSGWHIPVAQRVGMREVKKGGVYFVPHPSRVWVKVMVTEKGSTYSDTCRVRVFDDGTEMTMTGRDMVPACKGPQTLSNLASLPAGYVNEPEVLRILEMRSKIDSAESPYTFAGSSLLVINPLTNSNSITRTDTVELRKNMNVLSDYQRYSSMYQDTRAPEIPHPYTVAEIKYHQLEFEAEKSCPQQWIVGYGISGGGITTACSSVIHYLTWRGTVCLGNAKHSAAIETGELSLTNRLLTNVDTVLHSFFGAFTPGNSSSIRATRIMRMGYRKGGELTKMTLELKWPELLRVSNVEEGHRNFNVFYQLLEGADKDLHKRITVLPLDYYDYLNGGVGKIEDVNDGEGFKGLQRAFTGIGFSKEEQNTIFKLLGGILHLGNVSFKEDGFQDGLSGNHGFVASVRKVSNALSSGKNGEGASQHRRSRMSSISTLLSRKNSKANFNAESTTQSCIKITNKGALELSSSLLGLKSSNVEQVMLKGYSLPRGCPVKCSGVRQVCDLETAANTRDCIAKAVYNRIVSWILQRCNKALNASLTCKGAEVCPAGAGAISFINILDPPGFESHAEGNCLPQLLGNFACESIHSTLNAKTVLTENALLSEEGLIAPCEEPYVGGHDSDRVLSLIDGKNPPGILPLLEKMNSHSTPGAATVDGDAQLVSTLHQVHGHDRLYFPEILIDVGESSSLNYSFQVRHFMGVVQYSARSFSAKDSDPIWIGWVPKEVQKLLQTSTRGDILCCSPTRSPTSSTDAGTEFGMTTAFRRSVLDLLSEISNPAIIFGIRPNEKMRYGVFDPRDVAAQIRSLNVVQICNLARVGGWSHVPYGMVDDLYRPLLGSCGAKLRCVSGSRQLIQAVIWALSFSEGNVEWGENRLTFRHGRTTLLQLLLEAPRFKSAFISSRLRMWVLRRIVRLGLVWSRGLAALSELMVHVKNKHAALETLRRRRFLSIMRAAMQKTALQARVRARWRKVYLVVVAVRVLVAERELSCQAKRIQDEAQERVRNQAAKDRELLIRLDRYEKGERHQQAPREGLGCLSPLSSPSSSSPAIPRKRRAEKGAKDDGGVSIKEAPADVPPPSGDCGRTKSSPGGLRVDAERRVKVAKLREEVRMKTAVRLLKAEAAASTTTACIVRWQRVSLFRAFEKWLVVCDATFAESNGVLLRLKEGQAHHADNNSALTKEGKGGEGEYDNALLCEECEGARRAVFWCRDCPSIYCSICSNFVHSGSRVMRFHNPVLLDELGEDGSRLVHLHINRKDGSNSLHVQLNRRSSLYGIGGIQRDESSSSLVAAKNVEIEEGSSSSAQPEVAENHYRGVTGNVNKECGIKSCNKPATHGITIRFCEKHYMEFRNALAPKEAVETTDQGSAESLSRLTSQIELLKKQLEATGHQALEFVSLKTAKERMHEAVQKLMAGDDSAEKDIDKWDQTIRMHPDYAKEQEEKRVEWERENEAANQEALRKLRTFVPPDIFSSSVAKMVSEGVPRIVAQRIWKVKVLQWVRWHPDDVKKVHIADLQAKYSNQGLDVQEMRAIWAAIPQVFDLDSDGKKAQWRSFFSTKLRELTEKEAQGKLTRNELRAPAWKGLTEGPYDPRIPLKRKDLQKSTAFNPTEKPTAATILRSRSAAQQLGAAASPNLTGGEDRVTTTGNSCPSPAPPPPPPMGGPCTPTGRANIMRDISSLPGHGKKGGRRQKMNDRSHQAKDQVSDSGAPPPPPLPTPIAVNSSNRADRSRMGLMAEIQKSRCLSPTPQSSSKGRGPSSAKDRGDVQNALFSAIKARRIDDDSSPLSNDHSSSTAAVVDQGEAKNSLFAAIKARRMEPAPSSDDGSRAIGQGGAKNALLTAIKARRVDDDFTTTPSLSKCSDSITANESGAAQQQLAPFDETRARRMDSTASSQPLKVSNSGATIDERGTKSVLRDASTKAKVNFTLVPPPLPMNGKLTTPERGAGDGAANALFAAIKARRVDHPKSSESSTSTVSNSNGIVIDGSRATGRTSQNALFAAIRARRVDSPSQGLDHPIAKGSSKGVDGNNLLFEAIRARRVD